MKQLDMGKYQVEVQDFKRKRKKKKEEKRRKKKHHHIGGIYGMCLK